MGLSGGYICDDTNDEVFALSNQEIINYTGNSIHSSRIKHASSYATATGVPTSYNTIEEYEEHIAEYGEDIISEVVQNEIRVKEKKKKINIIKNNSSHY